MATRSTSEDGGGEQALDRPQLDDLDDGQYARCRNPSKGLTWFVGSEHGVAVRYHELSGFGRSVIVLRSRAEASIAAAPEVDVVGRDAIDAAREAIGA